MNLNELSSILDSQLSPSEELNYLNKLSLILNRFDKLDSSKIKGAVDKYLSSLGSLYERKKRKQFLYNRYNLEYSEDYTIIDVLDTLEKVYSSGDEWDSDEWDSDAEFTADLELIAKFNAPYVASIDRVLSALDSMDFNGKPDLVKWFSNCRSMARNKMMVMSWRNKVIAPFKKLPPDRDHSWDTNDLSWVKVWPYEIIIGRHVILRPGDIELSL